MSVQNPLRLLNLAGKSLLTDETLSVSAVEHLPIELFPPLFMEAFCGRRRKTLKALVQAWPFVRLPLGGLMQTPHLGTLQAVLDGLDILLTQKDQPRRCKLRVLDLRNTGQDFWRMWSGSSVHVSSSSSMALGAEDTLRTQQPLAPFEVFIELHLKERSMGGFLTYLMRWVEERKASIHLCCKKLRIISFSMDNIMKVLSMVQLDCIQEVYVDRTWHLSTLAMFAPLLGQMTNLQRLLISHIHMPDSEEQEEEHVVKITSQFLRLHCLRNLHLESPFYLEGCLDQMLRRCKLRVLDLRNTGQSFWNMWSGASTHGFSSFGMAPVAEQSSKTHQPLAPLKIYIELCLKNMTLDNFLTYLLRWMDQRKASIHLCCKKLTIFAMPVENVMKVLNMVQLDCIQEVQVNWIWHLSTLAKFAPLLGQMSNVQRLLLSRIHMSALEKQEQQEQVVQFTSQFLKLYHLQDLYLDSPSFLEGCLDQMLRFLRTLLDHLAITNCQLTGSDLTHLSQCLNIRQLKGLDLSGVTMTDFSPEILRILLEQVAATLQELNLEQCGITESQLESILPVLSCYSQLRTFSLCGNVLSMAIMEKLLSHITGLINHSFV
ncbi:hypothetical protein JEQ12_003872 [Ovis aries]|uniref:PRAME family member 8-like n=1 Tax=Ovis aries TaxID=9940 RepID=A0A836A7B4_SHEEP|nr:hypothetical protein JEQ12_003872 [Ovis aries]